MAPGTHRLGEGVAWFDDWYAVERIGRHIIAIGEPKHHYENWSYLIEGASVALLFDTGTGLRDIAPVVSALTAKPVTVLASHMHYDHVGNLHRFARIAMADLPLLRACAAASGEVMLPEWLHLGSWENIPWTPVAPTEWWPPGHIVDLGGVLLEAIFTPGHSPDSISLIDRISGVLFAADVLYPGELYGHVPGSNLPDYRDTVSSLHARIADDAVILCGHGNQHDAGRVCAPRMNRADLADLAHALDTIREGRSVSTSAHVNGQMTLLWSTESLGAWQNRQ